MNDVESLRAAGSAAQAGAAAGRPPEAELPGDASDEFGPPLTNRGSESAEEEQRVVCHLDYLKVTIFQAVDEVMRVVEEVLGVRIEEGWTWHDKGAADRWEHIIEGPGPLWVLVPKDQNAGYTMLDLKGEGCACYGDRDLFELLAVFRSNHWRWHAARVDVAFDHVAFTPQMVNEASKANNLNSRMTAHDRDWNENFEGQTAYLGRRCDHKPRVLRVYNKRGFTRCELELKRPWASQLVAEAVSRPLEDWPGLALSALRSTVDFVDRKASSQAARCPLLPWWAEFVGSVEKMRLANPEDAVVSVPPHPVGISEGRLQRCARSIWPILEAFGEEYLAKRIMHHAVPRLRDEDRVFADRLKDYRNCGLAGLDGDAEAVPF